MTSRIIRSAAFCLAAACLAGAAGAEGVDGRWKFRTGALPSNGCFISGDIVFRKAAQANAYTCEFVSQEDCVAADGSKSFQRVRQSCTARVSGKMISITSKVEQILDAGPAASRARMMQLSSYSPDDFDVEPNGKGELVGKFHSLQASTVRFWRDVDLVS